MMQQDDGWPSTTIMNGLANDGEIALAVLNALESRVSVIDERGRILFANKAWRQFSANVCEAAHGTGKCRGCPASFGILSSSAQDPENGTSQCVQNLLAKMGESFSFEYECRSKGSPRSYAAHVSRLPGNGPLMLLISHEDITERRRAEETQHRTARRLKQLGAHMEKVREEQSAMIARELHDELGSLLTMLKLDLMSTAGKVADPASLHDRLCELGGKVQAALEVVKRISTNLRPATLDTLGLMATIRWYVQQFSHTTGIAAELQLPEYVRLSDISNIAVFRIIQEGLTNVAAHAGATLVKILVHKESGELVIEIIDNGKGIAEEDMHRPNSFGIIGMQERTHYLGGTLSICGKPGEGSRLAVQIPLDS